MNKKTSGTLFIVAGMIFLLANALQYISGSSHPYAYTPIGIALVLIGAAIKKKGETADKNNGKS